MSPAPWYVSRGRDPVYPWEVRDRDDAVIGRYASQADARIAATAPDLRAVLVALLDRPGPLFHHIAEEDERHWSQIEAAREVLRRTYA